MMDADRPVPFWPAYLPAAATEAAPVEFGLTPAGEAAARQAEAEAG